MDLGLDGDELNSCVQCGLCLPHCPTYRVTGDEAMSPRGRIALMREVHNNDAPLTDEVVDSFNTCVQCRGCEPACPSSVPYGRLMEATKESLADAGHITPRWQRLAFAPLTRPGVLRVGAGVAALAARTGLTPKRFGLPTDVPLRAAPLARSGDDVHLFTGCVMDVWQRDVHHASQAALEASGLGVNPTGAAAPCCGALHTHAGLGDDARAAAQAVIDGLGVDTPVVVDAAGCGAAMKEYGHLLGTEQAHRFADQVVDVSEILATRLDQLPDVRPLPVRVAIQDPCHLRHVQRVHQSVRDLLARYVDEIVELDDDGMCCGAGGAFSVLHPQLAGDIRERKIAAIGRAPADVVASANPGCSLHLAAAGIDTVHPVQLVAAALEAAAGA